MTGPILEKVNASNTDMLKDAKALNNILEKHSTLKGNARLRSITDDMKNTQNRHFLLNMLVGILVDRTLDASCLKGDPLDFQPLDEYCKKIQQALESRSQAQREPLGQLIKEMPLKNDNVATAIGEEAFIQKITKPQASRPSTATGNRKKNKS